MIFKLIIDTTEIFYSIRRSHKAKYVSISIGENGVHVVAPISMNDTEIISLVEKKRHWIINKYDKYHQRVLQLPVEREFVSGEKHLFKGNSYPLKVIDSKGRFTKVNLTDGQLLVEIKVGLPSDIRREEIRRHLEKWYIREARELILERLEFFSGIIGVKVNNVRLKNQKTRWGSCSQKGNLNFNWKLVMAPIEIVDYVVVHELCHLKQMNHSPRFWLLVENQIRDYKKMRKWLKENGAKLYL
ncbi:M48 family metallopeptidase [Desulfosporosinus fructosivorans]